MRRTKSDSLHPANKMLASALALYHDPDHVYRYNPPNRNIDSLWNDYPYLPPFSINSRIYNFWEDDDRIDHFDEFLDGNGSSSWSFDDTEGGFIKAQVHDVDDGRFHFSCLESKVQSLNINEGDRLWMLVDFEAEGPPIVGDGDGNSNNFLFTFGLGDSLDTNQTLGMFPENGFEVNVYSSVIVTRIYKEDIWGATSEVYWDSIDIKNNEYGNHKIQGGDNVKVGLQMRPSKEDDDEFYMDFYIDNSYVGSTYDSFEFPDDYIGVFFGATGVSTTAKVKKVIVIQDAND